MFPSILLWFLSWAEGSSQQRNWITGVWYPRRQSDDRVYFQSHCAPDAIEPDRHELVKQGPSRIVELLQTMNGPTASRQGPRSFDIESICAQGSASWPSLQSSPCSIYSEGT
ncbi:hypothetical protein BJY01DRAFT_224842 [Aspergillus pseudoustus]|uniref:Secreted protein n=1 Tax=Aspergillus pseudoustus TaxID=1810923 RepID=A0ABR4J328_9EURO